MSDRTSRSEFRVSSEIRSACELATVATAVFSSFRVLPYFRGHASATWALQPSLFRPRSDGWLPADSEVYERSLVNDFVRFAPSRRERLPPLSDIPAWVCLMRHYGLPTRLLDWSCCVFVAAYFAVCSNRDEDADLWALNSAALNRLSTGTDNNLSMRSGSELVRDLVDRGFKDRPHRDNALFLIAPEVDSRLLVQRSAFTIHGTNVPLDQHPNATSILQRFRIPKQVKQQFAWELELLGFSEMHLFPDLEHLARDLALRQYGAPSKYSLLP